MKNWLVGKGNGDDGKRHDTVWRDYSACVCSIIVEWKSRAHAWSLYLERAWDCVDSDIQMRNLLLTLSYSFTNGWCG